MELPDLESRDFKLRASPPGGLEAQATQLGDHQLGGRQPPALARALTRGGEPAGSGPLPPRLPSWVRLDHHGWLSTLACTALGGLLAAAVAWRPARVVLLGVLLGLAGGCAVLLGRRLYDVARGRRPVDARDVAAITGAPVIAAIAAEPDAVRRPLVVYGSPRSPRAEAFRRLHAVLPFLAVDGPPRALVVTSAAAAEGRSTTCCNLAITAAYGGARVCLVEADLCQPSFAGYLGVDPAPGLTRVLIGAAEPDAATRPWGTGRVGDGWLDVLPSGPVPPDPNALLASQALASLLDRLVERYDLVIVDAPPLPAVPGTAVLASRVGGALLVARAGCTRHSQLRSASAVLAAAGAGVLGTVLTRVPTGEPAGAGTPARERRGRARGYLAGRHWRSCIALPALSALATRSTVSTGATDDAAGPVGSAAAAVARPAAAAPVGRAAAAARVDDETVSLGAITRPRGAGVPEHLTPAADA